jgi:hypothetical protein
MRALLPLLMAYCTGCVSAAALTSSGLYEFKNNDDRIEIDKGFRYISLNGERRTLKNCSDGFIVCTEGYISFSIPRMGCLKQASELPKLSEMEFAARNHHINRSWRYNSTNRNAIFEYNENNEIVAIYYDFSDDGGAIAKFIALENGRIDDMSAYRLEAAQPISAPPCRSAPG